VFVLKPGMELIKGAIDIHVHVGPDVVPRLMDCVQLAEEVKGVGGRGFVYKSHSVPTAPLAILARRIVPEVEVVGSLVLNNSVGGLNPSAVETSLRFGAKVVWMPTSSARNHIEYYATHPHPLGLGGQRERAISILKKDGGVVEEVKTILGLIADARAVLATGHLSIPEIKVLVEEAKKTGVDNIVVSHPLDGMINMSMEDQKEMAELGAYLEHTLLSTMPIWRSTSPARIRQVVEATGAEHNILVTDFGQSHHPSPVEGLRIFAKTMVEIGITEEEIKKMICDNPSKLLGFSKKES